MNVKQLYMFLIYLSFFFGKVHSSEICVSDDDLKLLKEKDEKDPYIYIGPTLEWDQKIWRVLIIKETSEEELLKLIKGLEWK